MIRKLCLIALASCVVSAQEAARRSIEAVSVDVPPRIDGRLDEPQWQRAPAGEGFVDPQSGDPARQPTSFRVLMTDQAVIFGISAREPDTENLRARYATHDSPLWSDDCVEIFLSPADDGMEYVQVIVNSLGATWDAYVTQMGVSSNPAFETGVSAAAFVGDGMWSAEISIPLAGLALSTDTGTHWGLNVGREKKTDPPGLSCWSPTGIEKFGVPDTFGLLTVPDMPFGNYAWDVSSFELTKPRFREDGAVDAQLAFTLHNRGTHRGSATVSLTLATDDGTTVTASGSGRVSPGSNRVMDIPVRIPGTITSIRYQVADGDSNRLLALGAQTVSLSAAPVELSLLAPWYRNSIFASHPIDTIEAEARVHGDQPQTFAVTLQKGDTVHYLKSLRIVPTQPTPIRIPAQGLATGQWNLALTDKKGNVTASTPVHVLPPHEGEACLDRRGRLLVDGKPFFAWGFMSAGPDERIANAGYNTVQTYVGFYIHRDKDLTAWLDQCHELGLKATMYCYPGELGLHINKDKKRFTDDELERIAEFVTLYRDHPAIIGWYLCDEPRGHILRAEMERVHDVVAKADPFHPCIVLDNSGRGAAELADAGEIVWLDPYPGFAKNGPPRMPLSMVAIAVDDMIRITGDRLRHFWVAPQAFDWGTWGGPKEKTERAPTYREERTMTYLSIVHGAQGIVYFAWKYVLQEPPLAEGLLNRLGPEIRDLMPVFLEGRDDTKATVSTDPRDTTLHTRMFVYDGNLTVIVVNPTQQSVQAVINVPGLGSETVHVISENRSVDAQNGTLLDRFEPATTHVYQTRR